MTVVEVGVGCAHPRRPATGSSAARRWRRRGRVRDRRRRARSSRRPSPSRSPTPPPSRSPASPRGRRWSSTPSVAAGQRVLVNGAGGGVGGFAVQLAKLAGAYVIATASPRSAATVRRPRRRRDRRLHRDAARRRAGRTRGRRAQPRRDRPGAGRDPAALVRPGGVVVSVTARSRAPAGVPVTRCGSWPATTSASSPTGEARRRRRAPPRHRRVAPARGPGRRAPDAESGRTRGKIILVPENGNGRREGRRLEFSRRP